MTFNRSREITLTFVVIALCVGLLAYLISNELLYFSMFMLGTYSVLMLACILMGKVSHKGKKIQLFFQGNKLQ
jgi:hypothetical protein